MKDDFTFRVLFQDHLWDRKVTVVMHKWGRTSILVYPKLPLNLGDYKGASTMDVQDYLEFGTFNQKELEFKNKLLTYVSLDTNR